MISFAAQGRFAAEFLAFLVSVAGLALVLLRAELLSEDRVSRLTLAGGFILIGAASFFAGSLIVADHANPELIGIRSTGVLIVLLGTRRWSGGETSRRLLWIGLLGVAVAQVLLLTKTEVGADVAMGIGAVGMGVALRLASGRSIAARVAASLAAILLLVVMVLSVSLSAVISNTVKTDEGRRLDATAYSNARHIDKTLTGDLLVDTQNIALTFATNAAFRQATYNLVNSKDPDSGQLPGAGPDNLLASFGSLQAFLAPDVAMAFINRDDHIYGLAAPAGFDQGMITAAIGSEAVKQAFAAPKVEQASAIAIQTFPPYAFAVAVQTVESVTPSGTATYPTAIVSIQPITNTYLGSLLDGESNLSLAFADETAVLARTGSPGTDATLEALTHRSFTGGGVSIPLTVADGRLLSAESITAGNQQVAVVIASEPETVVTNVRDKLLRELFLLALGGTLLALALAAYSGERVGEGLRILTSAAERIRGGDYSQPPEVHSEDEVGVLGAAFGSMSSAISEQTNALQRAAEEETALRSQLEAVIVGMGEALVAVDEEGRITLFNRAAEELLGLRADEVREELVGDVLVAIGEDGAPLGARLQRPTPTRWATTGTVANEDSRVPVAITAAPLRSADGAVGGAVFVLRDLRPEREVERIKNEFLSRIGHELRTPLTGILGYAEMLLRREIPADRAREMYRQIVDAGNRLYRVVQLLEFTAAAEAGRTLLRSEPVNIRSVLDEVIDGWGTRVNGNHTLARKVGRNLPEVSGDRRWLAMAIGEMIDNAVKFSPDGGAIGVSARAVKIDDGRPGVSVTVVDQGVGMNESEVDAVFAEFVQADGSDTRRFGGLGLGLSLVKRVAEAHGGRVDVESIPQKGSKFSITIPAAPI